MTRVRKNWKSEFVKDVLYASKVISVSIVKTILILPIAPLSRLISLLEGSSGRLDGILKRTAQRRAMRKSIPRQIIKGARIGPPYYFQHPIYNNYSINK